MGENTMIFVSSFVRALAPMASEFITSRIDQGLQEKHHNRQMQLLDKQKELLDLKEKKTTYNMGEIPTIGQFQFKEGEDVDELGNRMWNESHQATLNIPDNAKPHQVRNVMRSIEKSFRNHPCSECKEHAKENLKKIPLVKGINTKQDAVERLYEFHNEVNGMLDKQEFTRDDFQRQYGYKLN